MSRAFLSVVVFVFASFPARCEVPRTVAGRTIDEYAAQLGDTNRVVRLRAVRSLGAFDDAASASLREALDHDDAAVRYLAAQHLGRIGGASLAEAKPRLTKLAADQSSLAVRLAASFALCRAGEVDQYLPLLVKTLEHPERGIACSAAELIGNIGPPAAAVEEALVGAVERNRPGVGRGDYHVGGAAQNALRKIRAEP